MKKEKLLASDTPRRQLDPERGAAMVIVIALLIGLLAGGVTVLWLQIQSTRATGLVHNDRNALFCAEAGIAHGVQWFSEGGDWEGRLSSGTVPCNPPSLIDGCKDVILSLDIDPVGHPHHGINDVEITLWDNDDELTGDQNDPDKDYDGKVIMRSACIRYPDAPRYVAHLVESNSLPPTKGCQYRDTGGQGCGNTNNMN